MRNFRKLLVAIQVSSDALLSQKVERKDEDKKTFKCHCCKKTCHYARDWQHHLRNFVTNDPGGIENLEVALKSTNWCTRHLIRRALQII